MVIVFIWFLLAFFYLDKGLSLTWLLLPCHPECSCESADPVYPFRLDLLSSIQLKVTSPLLTLHFLLAGTHSLPLLHNGLALIASLVVFLQILHTKTPVIQELFLEWKPIRLDSQGQTENMTTLLQALNTFTITTSSPWSLSLPHNLQISALALLTC